MVQGNDSFCWQQADWGPALVCPALLPFAPHLFTTRTLALGLDDVSHQRARQAVAHTLGLSPSAVTWARQIHGTSVVIASAGTGADGPLADADILLTDRPDTAVSIRVADCVPILLADRRRGAVAAVHAGWRGTCAGAALVAVRAMAQRFGSSPGDLVAAVGPSIGPCCYQVGVEVRDAFRTRDGALPDDSNWFLADGDRWRLDLWAATRDQLIAAGLPAGQVHVSRECTAHALDRYYSYRAEASCAGRLMAAIRPAAAAR
jgi:hypothetical protein